MDNLDLVATTTATDAQMKLNSERVAQLVGGARLRSGRSTTRRKAATRPRKSATKKRKVCRKICKVKWPKRGRPSRRRKTASTKSKHHKKRQSLF